MKVNVKQFVQDPWAAERNNTDYIEGFWIEDEPFFMNGPVTRQVAVLDFDPETGTLAPGAEFHTKSHKDKDGKDVLIGRYDIADEHDLETRDLNQVGVFGTVFHTIRFFQDEEALGREITWAFGAPQLLVIPRAGEMKNAYYERDSHSLQFFFFDHPKTGKRVYTSQSRDIITHETSHAILDGIAPALYNAITPQSLALHEGFADLIAALSSFDSPETRVKALAKTGGTLNCSSYFSTLAEEFGSALDQTGLRGYLRDLFNQKTLDPADQSLGLDGTPNRVTRSEPHALCQVLTGALYAVMIQLHAERTRFDAHNSADPDMLFSASGKALAVSGGKFKRRLIRALDYLPVGEVSFADYGRAILVADRVAHPGEETLLRKTLIEEFVRRKIVPNAKALEVEFNPVEPALQALNLRELMESDYAAYQFAENNRVLLHIPAGVQFKVEPRLDVSKIYWPKGSGPDGERFRECLFKVSWTATEPNNLGPMFPAGRQVRVGTTLAIDWKYPHPINSLLTSDHAGAPEGDEQCRDRDELLRQAAWEGLLRPVTSTGPDGKELRSAVGFDTAENTMRVLGAAKLLHIVERM